jgi:hypothetical protein
MELILIACPGKKRSGGSSTYRQSIALNEALSPRLSQRLNDARHDLARILRQPPNRHMACPLGEDLGDDHNTSEVSFLEAYDRYDGVVYRAEEIKQRYTNQRSVRLTIISALYGLLDADDMIRHYNLQMACTLQPCAGLDRRTTVHNWWKQKGLRKILDAYVQAIAPTAVHDLVGNNYIKALEPWPTAAMAPIRRAYDYSHPPRLADVRRGEQVARLLSEP